MTSDLQKDVDIALHAYKRLPSQYTAVQLEVALVKLWKKEKEIKPTKHEVLEHLRKHKASGIAFHAANLIKDLIKETEETKQVVGKQTKIIAKLLTVMEEIQDICDQEDYYFDGLEGAIAMAKGK